MSRPRLLDLFCGAGGAAMGYHRAGFEVVGVDLSPQRHFPFEFHQADALTWSLEGFDAIHASPPCQAYSVTRHSHHVKHPELIEPTRALLVESGLPYVIENVVGAPLRSPLTLCGTMFNLHTWDDRDGRPLFLRRHRLFESNIDLVAPGPCECVKWKRAGLKCGGVYGGGSTDRNHAEQVRRGGYTPNGPTRRRLMGIDWGTLIQLNQAIPPAYTEWIGHQLLPVLAACQNYASNVGNASGIWGGRLYEDGKIIGGETDG